MVFICNTLFLRGKNGTMSSLKISVIFILIIFHFSGCMSLSQEKKAALEDFIKNVMICRNVTGLSLALVLGNDTVYTGGFGYRDLATKSRVTNRTLFPIASETKAFTSALAADAVARGKIKWDAPLKDIFGSDFKLQDEFRTEQASIRDQLSHRFGMPSYAGVSLAGLNLTRQEFAKNIQYFPVMSDFRTEFVYSNFGYILSGAAVEKATNQTWEDAIYSKLFVPLGMQDSRTPEKLTKADWDNLAYSYTIMNSTSVRNPEKEGLAALNRMGPAGAILSNAVDMPKWIKFHLREGKNESGHQIVDGLELQNTYTPTTVVHNLGNRVTRAHFPADDSMTAYGMGWFTGQYKGLQKLFHGGEWPGYFSQLSLLPEKKLGVWTAISSSEAASETTVNIVTMYAFDLLLGDEPWLNKSTACTFPEPWEVPKRYPLPTVPPPPLPVLNLTQYVGKYYHKGFGTVEVFQKEAQLHYTFGLALKGRLIPIGPTKENFLEVLDQPLTYIMYRYSLFSNAYGFSATFRFDRDGSVESVQLGLLDILLPPVFVKVGMEVTTPAH